MLSYHLATVLLLAHPVVSLASVDVGNQGSITVLEYKEWKSIGCQADSTSGRALKHLVAVASPTMTVESCLDSCQADGYALGGVEFGDECYCGNALLYGYGTSTACNKPCSGNTSEVCGGAKALNMYQFADTPFTTGPAYTVFSYKRWEWWGCQDETFPSRQRLLPHRPLVPIPGERMTVEGCLDGCEAAGYNAAALEAGQECYCDLVPLNDGGSEQPDGWESVNWFECADPCLGNATEICGGTSGTIDTLTDTGRLTSYLTCDYYDRCGDL